MEKERNVRVDCAYRRDNGQWQHYGQWHVTSSDVRVIMLLLAGLSRAIQAGLTSSEQIEKFALGLLDADVEIPDRCQQPTTACNSDRIH